jgi:phosphopentomutase
VDFDTDFGHRNDIDGYAGAISEFDAFLPGFMENMRPDDCLLITADHGCDPGTKRTDHSREYTPMLLDGEKIRQGVDLKTRSSFADIGKTVLSLFSLTGDIAGESFAGEVLK